MTSTMRNAFLLWGALVAMGALRVYGVGYAPTAPRARPDEEIFSVRSFAMFEHDDAQEILSGGFPEGFYRITHLMQWTEAEVLSLIWRKPVNLGCLYALNPGAVELPPRLFSVLMDLAGCLLCGGLVWRLVRPEERRAAVLLGVLAYGCNYLLARDAHFAVSDSTVTFACMLCLWAAVRACQDGPRFLPLAAAAAGAGFGVKYAGLAMFGTCAAAGLVCLGRFRQQRRRTAIYAGLSFLTAPLGFLLLSPGVLRFPKDFWAGVSGQSERYNLGNARGHLLDQSYVIPPGWRFHLFTNLPIAFGVVGLCLAVVGLWVIWGRSRGAAIIVLGSALGGFAIIAPSQMLFVRYAAPMVPALAVSLGVALAAFWSLSKRVVGRQRAIWAGVLVVAAALVPPAWTTFQFDRLMARPDTRDVATRWLLNQGSDAPAVTQGWYAEVQLLDPTAAKECSAQVPPWLNPGVGLLPPTHDHLTGAIARGDKGWAAIANDTIYRYLGQAPGREHARYILSGQAILPCGKLGPAPGHEPFDEKCYALRDVISPGEPECGGVMDLFDAFYLPYSGFRGQTLGGPRVEIYENLCRKKEAAR